MKDNKSEGKKEITKRQRIRKIAEEEEKKRELQKKIEVDGDDQGGGGDGTAIKGFVFIFFFHILFFNYLPVLLLRVCVYVVFKWLW